MGYRLPPTRVLPGGRKVRDYSNLTPAALEAEKEAEQEPEEETPKKPAKKQAEDESLG